MHWERFLSYHFGGQASMNYLSECPCWSWLPVGRLFSNMMINFVGHKTQPRWKMSLFRTKKRYIFQKPKVFFKTLKTHPSKHLLRAFSAVVFLPGWLAVPPYFAAFLLPAPAFPQPAVAIFPKGIWFPYLSFAPER